MKKPYNIVWIMTDEHRIDSLGCYGSPWGVSPSLDRLAESGTLFANAVTPAPLCVPARTSIITGKTVEHHGVWSNAEVDHPASRENLVERFQNAGYSTASFGKSHYAGYEKFPIFQVEKEYLYGDAVDPIQYHHEFDEQSYGVIKYPSPYTTWIMGGRFPEKEEMTGEHQATSNGLMWLDDHLETQKDAPFFLRFSFNGPHTPVSVPEHWLDVIDKKISLMSGDAWDRSTWPKWYAKDLWEYSRADRFTEDEVKAMQNYYYCQCAFVDSQIGRVLDYLEEKDLMESTIVAFCSDHGTHLGDYGFVQKQTFFEPVVKVPFIIKVPDALSSSEGNDANGKRIHTVVSTAQLLPTLLEINGLSSECDYSSLQDSVLPDFMT
jgi:arylsulfatase A-like enzyme